MNGGRPFKSVGCDAEKDLTAEFAKKYAAI